MGGRREAEDVVKDIPSKVKSESGRDRAPLYTKRVGFWTMDLGGVGRVRVTVGALEAITVVSTDAIIGDIFQTLKQAAMAHLVVTRREKGKVLKLLKRGNQSFVHD